MPALGVTVTSRSAPAAQSVVADIDTLFAVGKAASGPTTAATEVRSLADFTSVYGALDGTNARLYNGLDTFFREGGRRAIVSRYTTTVTGPGGLASFSKDMGPGLVAAWDETPGVSTITALHDHAAANNRFPLYDHGNGDTVNAMSTLGGSLPADGLGMSAGQWVVAPPPAGTIGQSSRQVPGSAVVAALISRAVQQGNPNRAAAGRDFPLRYVTGFVLDVNDVDRETLIAAGVNVFATKYRLLQLYGFQTGMHQTVESPFWQANAGLARMWLQYRAELAGEEFAFKTIDGRGLLAEALKNALKSVCLDLYNRGGLYGETAEDAFNVETGSAVNTETTIASGELHGVVEARLSPHARSVLIDLVSVPVTGRVTPPAA